MVNYNKKQIRKATPNGTTWGVTMGCRHCQRRMNDFAGGYSRGVNGELLCHPNAPNRPNCYQLVTVHGHEMPCVNRTCYEDHPDLLTYINDNKKPRKVKAPF
jgi:hypothetical protein